MEQMTDDEETERANTHGSGSKRILDESAVESKDGFKKARYSWQIKGKSSPAESLSEPQQQLDTANEQHVAIGGKTVSPYQSSSIVQVDEVEISNIASTSNAVIIKAKSEQSCAKSQVLPVVHHGNPAGDTLVHHGNPAGDTQTKFEMLREMGSEYSERIEEFLKARTGRYESDSDSDDEVRKDPSFEIPEKQIESKPRVLPDVPQQGAANKGRSNPDAPNPNNRHLVNISSWLWQKQELGCAIVDNVFNRTLEELGLSPDPEANLQATTRVSVENQSIEAAINQQGLAINDDIEEDSIASLPSSTNSDIDSFDACITNTEQGTNDTLSEIDENSDSLDSILSSKNESNLGSNMTDMSHTFVKLESSNVNATSTHASQAMYIEVSRTSRLSNNSLTEMDVSSSDAECSQRRSVVSKVDCSGKGNSEIHESQHGSSAMNVSEMNASIVVAGSKSTDQEQQEHGSDHILDLAVSTAIMSQGLNIR